MVQSRNPYTVQEVSAILRVSEKFVWRLCRDGKLPAVKIGPKWYIKRREFDEMLGMADPAPATSGRSRRSTALNANPIW